MKQLFIIINKNAGLCNVNEIQSYAKNSLKDLDCHFFVPETILEMQSICEKLDPILHEAVIIAGGDGTLQQCLGSLLNKNVPVCLYPCGTANDLANTNKLQRNWDEISYLIKNQKIHSIDIIKANGIPFSTVGGIGLGSYLCSEINKNRSQSKIFRLFWRFQGHHAYNLLAFKNIVFNSQKISCKVKIISKFLNSDLEVSSILICNQSKIAHKLVVSPGSQNNDGLFEVIIHKKESFFNMLKSLKNLGLQNNSEKSNSYLKLKSSELVLESLSDEDLKVFGDGEVIVKSKSVHFKIYKNALKMYSPLVIEIKKAA